MVNFVFNKYWIEPFSLFFTTVNNWVFSFTVLSVHCCLRSHLGCFFKKICLRIWHIAFIWYEKTPTAFMGTTAITVNRSVEIRSQMHTSQFEQHGFKRCFNFTLVECLIAPLPCGICIRRERALFMWCELKSFLASPVLQSQFILPCVLCELVI